MTRHTELFSTFATLPNVILYLVVGLGLLTVFTYLYTLFTPHDEFKLIRDGNTAAALSLGSGMFGFALPISVLIVQTANVVDLLLWAVIAGIIQCAAFAAARLILKSPIIVIGDDNASKSHVIFVAFVNIVFGLLNAAVLI